MHMTTKLDVPDTQIIHGLESDVLLTSAEAARAVGVVIATIKRWEREGKWPKGSVVRTPAGHRRWKVRAVRVMAEKYQAGTLHAPEDES
jgi:hypothetical protein